MVQFLSPGCPQEYLPQSVVLLVNLELEVEVGVVEGDIDSALVPHGEEAFHGKTFHIVHVVDELHILHVCFKGQQANSFSWSMLRG